MRGAESAMAHMKFALGPRWDAKGMSDTTRLGLKILIAGAVLGALADALLRATPWGVNLPIWAAAFTAAVLALAPFRRQVLAGGGYWLLAPAAFFSVAFAWRDSIELLLLNLFALVVTLSLLILRAQGARIRVAGFFEYGLGSLIAAANATLAPIHLVLKDIDWKELKGHSGKRPALAVGRGILLAVPPVLLFGALFAAADPVFDELVTKRLRLSFADLPDWLSHFFLAAFFAWIVAGFLRGTLLGKEATWAKEKCPALPSLGSTEVSIVLGAVDALFLAFVIVQLRYFFGGSELVQRTIGLTYADYARRGFFELVTVAALVLPLLLTTHWLLRNDSPSNDRTFRVVAGVQVLLLFVIMASALERMRLYEQEYGLTAERLYATAFMLWLAVVFVWFCVTVLRGNRKPFAFGALVAGYVLIAGLNVLNPDAFIMKTNLARAFEGRKFDISYAGLLSADATTRLVEALPRLGPQSVNSEERYLLAANILGKWKFRNPDWRTWNSSRAEATRVVLDNESALRRMALKRP
jgi:hypothetical protein